MIVPLGATPRRSIGLGVGWPIDGGVRAVPFHEWQAVVGFRSVARPNLRGQGQLPDQILPASAVIRQTAKISRILLEMDEMV